MAHGEFFMVGAVLAWWIAGRWRPSGAWLPCRAAAGTAADGRAGDAGRPACPEGIGYDPERTIVATIAFYVIQQVTLMTYGPDARPVEAPSTTACRSRSSNGPMAGLHVLALGARHDKLQAGGDRRRRDPADRHLAADDAHPLRPADAGTQLDRETAQAFAIPVGVYVLVFGLGAGLAALGGVLIVPIQQAHYLMGHDPLLLSFIVVIIGGLGSLPGTVVAALLIGISDGMISVFFSPTLAKIIATLAVAFVLVFRPQGLFGKRSL